MAYRDDLASTGAQLSDIERRLRAIEQPGCCPPDPGWILVEVDGILHYVYAPTGALGPTIGRKSGHDPDRLSVTGGIEFDSAGAIQTSAFTGDVVKATGGTVLTIPIDTVTFAQMQDLSGPSILLGHGATAGNEIEEITLGPGLTMVGSVLDQAGGGVSDGDKGDITVTGVGTVWTIDDDVVTYAKMQDVSAPSVLLGHGTGIGDEIEELTLGPGLSIVGTILDQVGGGVPDGDKGDITVSGVGTVWTIDNDVVTFAKMQNIDTDRLLGRDAAGVGDPEELTVAGGVEFTGAGGIQTSAFTGDVTKAAGGTVLTIPDDTVTYAKMQDVSLPSVLLGHGTGVGDEIEEITLGPNLVMTGTILDTAIPITTSCYITAMAVALG